MNEPNLDSFLVTLRVWGGEKVRREISELLGLAMLVLQSTSC